MKAFYLTLTVAAGLLLMYGVSDAPAWGDPNSPANTHVSPEYIEKSFEKTEVPNMVTAVLADYRSFDTFGETTVVFTAGICCLLILRRLKED